MCSNMWKVTKFDMAGPFHKRETNNSDSQGTGIRSYKENHLANLLTAECCVRQLRPSHLWVKRGRQSPVTQKNLQMYCRR